MSSPRISEIFDLTVEIPLKALKQVHSMSVDRVLKAAFPGGALWQHLVGQAIVAEAGDLYSENLTEWRRLLVDHRHNHRELAWKLGVAHHSRKVDGHDVLMALLQTISEQDGEDAAASWISRLVRPAAVKEKEVNAPRLAALVSQRSASYPLPPSRERAIFEALYKANVTARIQTQRPHNPYTISPGSTLIPSPSQMFPPSVTAAHPAKRERDLTAAPPCRHHPESAEREGRPPKRRRVGPSELEAVAGPSRLPLAEKR
ncbi:hypothetical protein C8R43DRAFT_1027755 [Mycena crocata]|nr:hypothetical protein C8R43DRAFT_1027755 [Mycena crocata]